MAKTGFVQYAVVLGVGNLSELYAWLLELGDDWDETDVDLDLDMGPKRRPHNLYE